jgi:Zn-dependent metalloprotease
MTVVKRGQAVVLVIGAHYPDLRVTNTLKVTGPQAAVRATANKTLRDATSAETRANLKHRTELWLNPADGRLFHRVESGGAGVYVISQIDAETGAIIDSWNALPNVDPGEGTGVRNDLKDLGLNGPDLTFQESPGGLWRMQTANGRIRTLNATNASPNGNMNPNWTVLGDDDNAWEGPLQRAAVDAQYYTALTDGWYMDAANVGVFDLVSDCATSGYADLRSAVHIGNSYSNAFFDPSTGMFGYGDGDGFQFRAFSGGQDIVSHEVTHRVTECRAPLEYKYQPGALNEAISDIMATTMEWEINEPTSTNCRRQVGQGACPDWWVGEDIVLAGDFGFRNLADPETAGNPSHWDDRVCKNEGFCSDGGGVHSNSLIPGHAFYLMVNGGRNARCSGPTDPQADCDVVVPQIPMDDAAELMFAAW